MILDGIEFLGVSELTERFNGRQLQRIPAAVRDKLNDRGRWNSQQTSGVELRFVCDAPHIRLFLSSLEGDAPVDVYCGEFLHSSHHLSPGGPLCIHVEPPAGFPGVRPGALNGRRFASCVWRFVLPATQTVFHELETYGAPVRPPAPGEAPGLLWLAYGSSITAGGYVRLAAERLGVDHVNLAMGGACHCEPELADFVAARDDWDVATLELGVNMRERFDGAAFRDRVGYWMRAVVDRHPEKPVFLITPFPNAQDFEIEPSLLGRRQEEFTKILREFAASGRPNLAIIEGHDLLADFTKLNVDLIHPSPEGHAQIAERLAARLQPVLADAENKQKKHQQDRSAP
jgi:hypothetical protein